MKLKLTCLICCFLTVSGLHAQSIPLFRETFDNIPGPTTGGPGTYVFPAGWTVINVLPGNTTAWTRAPLSGFNGDLTHPNDTCAVAYGAEMSSKWMWTPAIDLSGSQIRLSWRARAGIERRPAIYQARIMTAAPTGGSYDHGNMLSSTILFSIVGEGENFEWTSRTADLSAYSGQKVYIGFHETSYSGSALLVDNVTVETNFAITSTNSGTIFSNTAAFSVAENAEVVTTVTATNQAFGSLRYYISAGADAGKFSINSTTGVLSFLTPPDFEAPGDANTDNIYEVTVQATNGAQTDVQTIKVTVTDINEIAFTSYNGAASAAVSVAENQAAVTTVTATTILSQPIAFRLAGSDDDSYFTINSTTGQLSFRNAPDFERPSDPDENNLYMVTVEASAGSYTALQRLKVKVTNVNDNAPEFGSFDGDAAVTLKLPENTTAVGTVWAVDKEPGTTLTYSISTGNEGALFSIDATTGALRFITAPDYENPADQYAGNAYIVTVQASDGQLSSLQRFKIKVTDVNEGTARMSSDSTSMSAAMRETESAPSIPLFKETFDNIPGPTTGGIGTYAFPAGWTLIDVDGMTTVLTGTRLSWTRAPLSGFDGDLTHPNDTCAVAPSSHNPDHAMFSSNWMWTPAIDLSGSSIRLSWRARSNIERKKAFYEVRIMTDAPVGGISNTGNMFSSTSLFVMIGENFEWTSRTVDLSAYSGQKVYIGFRESSMNAALLVDNVTVETDFAITSTSSATIFNNEASFSVAENVTVVTVVTAGNEAGGSLSYSITGGADAGRFGINRATGLLFFLSRPDFEAPVDANTDNVYEVTVGATNGTLTDVQNIQVTVTDVAEIAFTSYNGAASAAVNVAENQTAVTRMAATTILSQPISFRLAGSDDDSYFTINSASGQLSFRNAPDFERPSDPDENNLYLVTVEASAGSYTALQRLKVRVTNVNDNAPEFGSFDGDASVTLKIPENTTAVGTVWAVDKEPGTTIAYSISAGNDGALFSIDATTGVLWFITAPDYENPADQYAGNAYIVTVQASDGQLRSLQRFKIKVTDVNEGSARMSSDNKTMATAVGETGAGSKGISVFPNPVTGKRFTLRASGLAEGKYLLELYTSTGQLVYRYPLNHSGKSMSYPIQLPATVSKGMHVLKLAGTGVTHTEKLLIE